MGEYVAAQVVKLMIRKGIQLNGAELLMLGITFTENFPDLRNIKIVDMLTASQEYGIKVTIYNPWTNPVEVMHECGLTCHAELNTERSRSTESNPSPITNKIQRHRPRCSP